MADDKKIQQAAEEAKAESDSAKDAASDAQKAEEKAAAASDAAEDAAQAAGESAKEAEKTEEKAEKVAEKVEEAAKEVKEDLSSVALAKDEKKETPKAQFKVSKKLEDIIDQIEKLSVLELSELVHALETKFGVTAAAPIAVAAAGSAQAAAGDEGASEQTSFNVILAESGANKISVIKAIRELVPTLGLKEAKDLVDAAPKPVLEGVNKESANEAKSKLEAAGAKVELK